MSEKEIIVQFSELNRMSFHCTHCGVGVIGDFTQSGFGQFDNCPGCNREFPERAKAAAVAFSRFFREATESKCRFEFRVVAPN